MSAAASAHKAGFGRRVAKGTLANIIRQVLNVIGQIVLLPILLVHWGDQLYGEWQILSATVSYIVVLDFGMQTYVVNLMCKCYARDDMNEFNRILHSALGISAMVCAAAVLVVIPGIVFAPVDSWFHLSVTDRPTAAIVILIVALQTVFSLPLGLVAGVYRAVGEYARDITIANVHRLATLLVTAVIVIVGGSIVAVATMQLLALLLVLAFLHWDIPRRYSGIHLGYALGDRKLALSFIAPSAFFFLIQMATALSMQGSTLLVGASLGATSVAAFATLRALVNLLPQTTGSLSSALWPEFTALEALGEYRLLDWLHRVGTKLMLWICICAAVFLHFTGRDIVALWTGNRISYDQNLMDAFLLLQIATTWYLISSLVLSSSNNHRTLAICRFASCASGLALGWLLGGTAGLAGIVLGLTLAEALFCGCIIPISACRLLGANFKVFAGDVLLRGVIFSGLLYAVGSLAFKAIPGTGLEKILLMAITVSLVGPTLAYVLLLSSHERGRLRCFVPGRILLRPVSS